MRRRVVHSMDQINGAERSRCTGICASRIGHFWHASRIGRNDRQWRFDS